MPKNVNPNQFKMFMTSDEIKGYVKDSVDRFPGNEYHNAPAETMDKVWKDKLAEANTGSPSNESLVSQVREHGVYSPVIIRHDPWDDRGPVMGNGHHRVAAAGKVEREKGRSQFIPMIHDEHTFGSEATQAAFPGIVQHHF